MKALLLAANQGIVMVLGMVVIGALVGAGALGFDVITGFAQGQDFGKGLAAGIAIVLLGIMLDRITQGAGAAVARPRHGPAEPARIMAAPGGQRRSERTCDTGSWAVGSRGGDGRRRRDGLREELRRDARAPPTQPRTGGGAAASGQPSTAPAASQGVAAATCKGDGDKGTVKMMINQWVGAEANVAVAQCLLQQMGYTVKTKTLAEELAWQGFDTGEVDVILENWGHPDLEKKYITDTKLATDAGPNGVTGIIGWYVPDWMVDKYPGHPRLAQPEQVRRPVQDHRVRRQGPVPWQRPDVRPVRRGADHEPRPELQGRLLRQRGGDDLRLPGGRQEQDAADRLLLRPAVAPERDQARPDQAAGLYEGLRRRPEEGGLRLPAVHPEQDRPHELAHSGGAAGTFIKNFKWGNADQNEVADNITNKKMSAEDAAKAWVDAHPDVWQAWIPSS